MLASSWALAAARLYCQPISSLPCGKAVPALPLSR